MNNSALKRRWWKEAVVYQIYPRSFFDSNGDGIGDLKGIISKLDYIKSLGIDVIWLCPIYKSPNYDNGYDISDYQSIMDEFGNIDDVKNLICESHKRGLKLIMDLVVNHTSDKHSWFVESRKSKDNPYRDYYFWRPGSDGREPNNWFSLFGGNAWKFDELTGEYYLHLFSEKQPDLNWENPKVRNEVYDLMTWWFEFGIDGFRMDVINMISKAPGLPNAESPLEQMSYIIHGPRVHEYLQEMNRKVLSKYDNMTVGECFFTPEEEARKYVGEDRNELNMIFQMEHVMLDTDMISGDQMKKRDWKLTELKEIFKNREKNLDGIGWNSQFLMNHDQPRAVSRFGNDKEYRVESAKMLATFLLTLKGTPFIYQGEEIGMTNVSFDNIDHYRDLNTFNYYNSAVNKGDDPKETLKKIHLFSRDNARTPMQWDNTANAGFSQGTPWIEVNPNYNEINVEDDMKRPDSIFSYYRQLISLRRENPVLVYGKCIALCEDDEQIMAYVREMEDDHFLIILNFSSEEALLHLPNRYKNFKARLVLNNTNRKMTRLQDEISLSPYEASVFQFHDIYNF